jgi:Predicted acyltransferases
MFHAKMALSGGYLGVDVFFVISGYLITSLIIKELQKGTFTFVAFWERRIRRIVPATSVMVVAVLVAGWFLLLPNEYVALGKSAMAFAGYCGKHFFSAKYQRLFCQWRGNASTPYLVFGS